jgi:hypothetical protein
VGYLSVKSKKRLTRKPLLVNELQDQDRPSVIASRNHKGLTRNFTRGPTGPYTLSMHAWEGNPRLDESSEYRSLEPTPECTKTKSERPHSISWRVLAVFAAGSLLGLPFLATGNVHAAWAQISHMFASLRR